jgi:hypothetical protein
MGSVGPLVGSGPVGASSTSGPGAAVAGPRIGDLTENETTGSIERITDADHPVGHTAGHPVGRQAGHPAGHPAGAVTEANTAPQPAAEPPSSSVKEASAKADAAAARQAATMAALASIQNPGTSGPAPSDTAKSAKSAAKGAAKSAAKGAVESSGAMERSEPAEQPTSGKRVRVILSQRKGNAQRSVRTVVEMQELTQVGELLSASLIRSQLALALRIGGVVTIALGSLPAIFVIFPVLGRVEFFGVRLPWLLLGVLSYPFMLALGYLHARSAERLEQVFADHIQS